MRSSTRAFKSSPSRKVHASRSTPLHAHMAACARARASSTCFNLLRFDTVLGLTRVPQRASVMSSTRRTESPPTVQGSLALFGTYTVDEAEKMLIYKVESTPHSPPASASGTRCAQSPARAQQTRSRLERARRTPRRCGPSSIATRKNAWACGNVIPATVELFSSMAGLSGRADGEPRASSLLSSLFRLG